LIDEMAIALYRDGGRLVDTSVDEEPVEAMEVAL
jgi:hypothetical protein